MRTYIADRRVHRIFPRGSENSRKKVLACAKRAWFFCPPPLGNFRPPSGGGEIFPEGGEKKISVTLKRARSARDFFSPSPERGATKSQRGGQKKNNSLESKLTKLNSFNMANLWYAISNSLSTKVTANMNHLSLILLKNYSLKIEGRAPFQTGAKNIRSYNTLYR